MSKSTQRKARDSSADSLILKRDRIRQLLKTQLLTFPQKELFEEEIGNWERDLDPFPIAAIEWAFDNWRRNGRFFPVYGDILNQCIGWEPPDRATAQSGCSKECSSRHGHGYHWNDIKRLNALVVEKIQSEGRTADNPLTEHEIDALLAKVDQVRKGGAPESRR